MPAGDISLRGDNDAANRVKAEPNRVKTDREAVDHEGFRPRRAIA